MKNPFTNHPNLRATVLAVVMALLVTGCWPQSAQAQWAVFDAHAYAELWQIKVDERTRFVEILQQYAEAAQKTIKMISQNAEQISTTHGILDLAERNMLKDEKLSREFAALGKNVRDIFKLQRTVEALVFRDIKGLREIKTRLDAGIFDPAANRKDLEDYLRNSIGLAAENYFRNQEELAAMDLELARWMDEALALEGTMATVNHDMEGILHDLETNQDQGKETPARQALFARLAELDARMDELKKQHSEKISLIQERYRRYHLLVEGRQDTALKILKSSQAWKDFLDLKEEDAKLFEEEYRLYADKESK